MIVWIDGTFGVGKSTTAEKLQELFVQWKTYTIYSDKCWLSFLQHSFLGGGCYPQNNIRFLGQFKERILNCINQGNEIIIVDLALTDIKCRDNLLNELLSEGIDILHFILDADDQVIKDRISSHKTRTEDEKKYQKRKIAANRVFFLENYKDAIWINAESESSADEIFRICVQKMGVKDDHTL